MLLECVAISRVATVAPEVSGTLWGSLVESASACRRRDQIVTSCRAEMGRQCELLRSSLEPAELFDFSRKLEVMLHRCGC